MSFPGTTFRWYQGVCAEGTWRETRTARKRSIGELMEAVDELYPAAGARCRQAVFDAD